MGHELRRFPPPGTVRYGRPSSDEIALQTNSPRDGHVRLLEAYDPGWTATVDGHPAPVADSGGIALAVPVPAGCHAIRLRLAPAAVILAPAPLLLGSDRRPSPSIDHLRVP